MFGWTGKKGAFWNCTADTNNNTVKHEATQGAAAEAEVHFFFSAWSSCNQMAPL